MIYTIVLFNDEGAVDETIVFDSVSGFDETYSSSIPQAPVENGFSLSDHIIKGNDKFSLSGVITDSLFRRKGALIQYVNGRFVRMYEDVDPLPTENPIITMKARIKKLRDDREIFGVFESLRGFNETETSQVNLIYPCALTDVSFSNKDGGNAIYPNMSFERIRVSTVDFKVVENPSPELIPHIKHNNGGNQTGDSGAVKIADADSPDLKAQADAGKSVVPKELKKEETWADKKVAQQQKQKDILLATNKAKEKASQLISEGKLEYGQSGAYVSDQVSKEMKPKYGAKWDE